MSERKYFFAFFWFISCLSQGSCPRSLGSSSRRGWWTCYPTSSCLGGRRPSGRATSWFSWVHLEELGTPGLLRLPPHSAGRPVVDQPRLSHLPGWSRPRDLLCLLRHHTAPMSPSIPRLRYRPCSPGTPPTQGCPCRKHPWVCLWKFTAPGQGSRASSRYPDRSWDAWSHWRSCCWRRTHTISSVWSSFLGRKPEFMWLLSY